MNNKDKGRQLEIFVAEALQEILQENPPIRPTKASSGGARNTEIGDILSTRFYVECKSHKGKWFKQKTWTNLLNSLPFNTQKIPLYIIEHEIEGRLVCLSFADFCRLLKK